jgi:hypothetical protein
LRIGNDWLQRKEQTNGTEIESNSAICLEDLKVDIPAKGCSFSPPEDGK